MLSVDALVTAMEPLVPVIEPLAVSVAERVWFPVVFSVATNVPVPAVSVLSADRLALPSMLLK